MTHFDAFKVSFSHPVHVSLGLLPPLKLVELTRPPPRILQNNLATTVVRHGAFLTHKLSLPFMQRNKPNV